MNHDLAIANDIESVEAFFSKACAPGPADGERICTGCSGDCSDAVRPSAQRFSVRRDVWRVGSDSHRSNLVKLPRAEGLVATRVF